MKKNGWILLIVVIIISAQCSAAIAKNIPNGRSGKSNIAHLYLFEKNPMNWSIIQDGSWGKMKYEISGETFDFVFNGHNLSVNISYTLIYYPDPWPGKGLICLGSGIVNDDGNIHISEEINTGSLPFTTDNNSEWGAKIWLVLSEDVSCEEMQMIGWSPEAYLFEYDAIRFIDTDDEIGSILDLEAEGNNSFQNNSNVSNGGSIENDTSNSTSESEIPMNENYVSKNMGLQKMKFTSNKEKIRNTFLSVLAKMSGREKEELPPGIQKIMLYFFQT